MAALKVRLTEVVGQLFSQSQLAEAINYTLNHWDGLTLFLDDGRVEVDTNTVERSMRPIAMGRRNSLFSGSEGGAESWAILASLVNTAKLHELDPQTYSGRRAGAHRLRPNQEPSTARAAGLELEGGPRGASHKPPHEARRRRSAHVADDSGRHAARRSLSDGCRPVDRRPPPPAWPCSTAIVAAIVAGPVSMIRPTGFARLLAIDADAFNHGGTPEFAAISAVAVRHNVIVETLSTAPKTFEPIFARKPNGDIDAGPWCHGFYAAMKLRLSAWAPLLESRRTSITACCCPSCSTASTIRAVRCSARRNRGRH